MGGRWNAQARCFVRDLVRLRAYRAPPAVRAAATAGWARPAALVEHASSTALGGAWLQPLHGEGPPLDHAALEGQSRLPLRP